MTLRFVEANHELGEWSDVRSLEVEFQRDGDRINGVRSIRLDVLDRDNVPAATLGRFPWSTWLKVAEHHARAGTSLNTDQDDGWLLVADVGSDDPAVPKLARGATSSRMQRDGARPAVRPGRRGHPRSFYEEIARRVTELVQGRETRPARVIAHERHVREDTAYGWISQCRAMELLPASQRHRRPTTHGTPLRP